MICRVCKEEKNVFDLVWVGKSASYEDRCKKCKQQHNPSEYERLRKVFPEQLAKNTVTRTKHKNVLKQMKLN